MTRGPGHNLTEAEIQQLEKLFIEGRRPGETSKILGVSATTIAKHYARLRRKYPASGPIARGRGYSLSKSEIVRLEWLYRAGFTVSETVRRTQISKSTVVRHFKEFRKEVAKCEVEVEARA